MDTKGLQKEFINWCKSKNKQPKSEDETKQLFVAFMKEKHPEEYKQAVQNQQKQQQAQAKKAAHGTKLTYFKSLKNQCAEDEEVVYFKKGGSVRCGCKKKEDGGEIAKAQNGTAIDKFKNRKKEIKQDQATRDSIRINSAKGDSELEETRPGSYKPNPKHNPKDPKSRTHIWVPDRTKEPYKKDKVKKDCGGSAIKKFKAIKAQYGAPLNLSANDVKNGAKAIWNFLNPTPAASSPTQAILPNGKVINIPGLQTGAPEFLPGRGAGDIGKVVGQIRKLAPGVRGATSQLKDGTVVNSLAKKVRMAKNADLRKEAGLPYWKNLAGRLEK